MLQAMMQFIYEHPVISGTGLVCLLPAALRAAGTAALRLTHGRRAQRQEIAALKNKIAALEKHTRIRQNQIWTQPNPDAPDLAEVYLAPLDSQSEGVPIDYKNINYTPMTST